MALPNSHSPPKLGQSIEMLNWWKWSFYHLLKLMFWVRHCGWLPRICSFSLTEYHQWSSRNWPWVQWCILLVQEYFKYPLLFINSRMDKWPKSDQLCRSNCMEVSGKVHSNQWLSINLSFKWDVFVAELILTATLQSWGRLTLVWSQHCGWQNRKTKRTWSLMA